MKICPACKQAYSDESLNFCLSDGTVLVQSAVNHSLDSLSSAQTVVMPEAPVTGGKSTPATINSWPQQPVYLPPGNTKTGPNPWIWTVGILLSLLVLGGIGVVGLIALAVAYGDNTNTNQANRSANSNNSSNNDPSVFMREDLSKWRREENAFGKTDFENDEFVMNSKATNYYYVLVSGDKNFLTSNVTTRVTLRNITGKGTKLGYGLVVNSDPTEALKKDYAFLIDTVRKSYRIVIHSDKKETDVVKWTPFSAIREGTQTNEIRVKDEAGKLTLFINGQLVTSIKDTGDYKDGVAGLYVSDAIPIAFSNLELSK